MSNAISGEKAWVSNGRRSGAPGLTVMILTVILGILVMLLRPTAIGEVLSLPISAGILGVSTFIFLLVFRYLQLGALKRALPQLVLFALLVLYTSAHGLAAGGRFAEDAMKFLGISIAGVMAILAVSLNEKTQRQFFDTVAIFITIVSASVLVTFLILAAGVPLSSIRLFHFEYTYISRGDVLFPFSFSYNQVQTWVGIMPRLSGIFREPGLLPAFVCWAATYAHLRRWPLIISVLNISASALCLSSLGLPLALYTGGLILMSRLRIPIPLAALALAGVAIVAWPVLYGLNDIGLGSKISSNSISFRERMYILELSFSGKDLLFGDGPQSSYLANSGITLLAQTKQYGLVYLVGCLALYSMSMRNFSLFIYGLVPALVTLLFSQPPALDIPVLILFLSHATLQPAGKHLARASPRPRAFTGSARTRHSMATSRKIIYRERRISGDM